MQEEKSIHHGTNQKCSVFNDRAVCVVCQKMRIPEAHNGMEKRPEGVTLVLDPVCKTCWETGPAMTRKETRRR